MRYNYLQWFQMYRENAVLVDEKAHGSLSFVGIGGGAIGRDSLTSMYMPVIKSSAPSACCSFRSSPSNQ